MKINITAQFALVLLLQAAAVLSHETTARRPDGANAKFAVQEFRGSNGHVLPYSLLVPKTSGNESSPAKLPLVFCLHGSGGNTAAANVLADFFDACRPSPNTFEV